MGVQYILCPRALFHRNVKQGFCVQVPAEYSEMGFFISSPCRAEIWLSCENVSQYSWGLLHRAEERWRLHCNAPLAPCWVTVCPLLYKVLLHFFPQKLNIFIGTKSGVGLSHWSAWGNKILGICLQALCVRAKCGVRQLSRLGWSQGDSCQCFFHTDHEKMTDTRKLVASARARPRF